MVKVGHHSPRHSNRLTDTFQLNTPAVRQRLIRLPSDLDGYTRVKRARVPIQEPMPEEPHSANARDIR